MSGVLITKLGLTKDEIALLRHHQQAAGSTAGGSSGSAVSRASSQDILLLDSASLNALSRHFDRLMEQMQTRLDNLYEQSQAVAQQQYDREGNAIALADSDIARFHDILRQIDDLELDFDRILHIRDMVKSYRQRLEEVKSSLPENGVRQALLKRDGWPSTLTAVQRENRTQQEVLDTRNDAVAGKQTTEPSEQVANPASKNTMDELHRDANLTVAVSVSPPTDSGYASMTRGMAPHIRNTQVGNRIQGSDDLYSSPNVSEGLEAAVLMNLELSQNQALEESQDIRTIYSDSASLPPFQKENYISALARDLRHKINLEHLSYQNSRKITDALPELLKAFAIKLGYNAPNQMRRNIMWFVYKYRNEIAKSFENISADDEESLLDVDVMNLDRILPEEKISHWRQKLKYPMEEPQSDVLPESEGQDCTECIVDYEEEEIDETNMPGLPEYQGFLFKCPAYEWLIATLQREVTLVPPAVDVMKSIGEEIIRFLLSTNLTNKISRKKNPLPYKVRFEIPWDPIAFIQEQEYNEDPERAVEIALTLTGSARNAQALSCVEYMRQTWSTVGDCIIQLVKSVVRNRHSNRRTMFLPDDTKIVAWLDESELIVEALGTRYSVAEIGKQLAWLGAALRSSTSEHGVTYCTPFISDIHASEAPRRISQSSARTESLCKINFRTENEDEFTELLNGQCWYNMFRNPVIVKGYPIRARTNPNTGLEVPLNVIAGLVRSKRANSFDGKLYIKGFSTLLVPTKRHTDILIWHLLHNKDGNRISYLDNTVPCTETVSFLDLTNTRHVIGWCSEVKNNTGTRDAKYIIQRSRLPEPPSGSVLEKVTITGGQFITGGAEFCLGRRDSPVHVSRNGYVPQLKWISKKFVVFWDDADKIGWLVNGTSALLHLVRASLEHDSTDKFSSEFLFKQEEMQESREPYTTESALEVLLNNKNKKLPIYPEKEGFIRFENRVEHIYNILEKLIDHQIDVARQTGVKLKPRARKYLEGWEFKDLATDQDPFYPHVATLPTIGKGWVDFTRAIHAVNLFGRGFGELIQPMDSSSLCPYWTRVPIGKYYLAACVADVKEIMEVEGNPDSNPMKLCRNILWHNPDRVFDTCQCIARTKRNHSDLVQVLLPSRLSKILPKRDPIALQDHGAVLFGHNWNFNWHWKDHGDPVEGKPPSPSEEMDSVFYDSGIGSSPGSHETIGSSDLQKAPSADENPSDVISDPNSSASTKSSGSAQKQKKVFSAAAEETKNRKRRGLRHILSRLRGNLPSDAD